MVVQPLAWVSENMTRTVRNHSMSTTEHIVYSSKEASVDQRETSWRSNGASFEKCLRSSVRTSPGAQNTGWMDINTVMEIFRQMSVLQGQTQKIGSKESNAQHRIIHMDLRTDHFRV